MDFGDLLINLAGCIVNDWFYTFSSVTLIELKFSGDLDLNTFLHVFLFLSLSISLGLFDFGVNIL